MSQKLLISTKKCYTMPSKNHKHPKLTTKTVPRRGGYTTANML